MPDRQSTDGVNHGKKSRKFNQGLHDLPLLPLEDIRMNRPEMAGM